MIKTVLRKLVLSTSSRTAIKTRFCHVSQRSLCLYTRDLHFYDCSVLIDIMIWSVAEFGLECIHSIKSRAKTLLWLETLISLTKPCQPLRNAIMGQPCILQHSKRCPVARIKVFLFGIQRSIVCILFISLFLDCFASRSLLKQFGQYAPPNHRRLNCGSNNCSCCFAGSQSQGSRSCTNRFHEILCSKEHHESCCYLPDTDQSVFWF